MFWQAGVTAGGLNADAGGTPALFDVQFGQRAAGLLARQRRRVGTPRRNKVGDRRRNARGETHH